ncbi:uncharacterized protein ACN427_002976 [Glossina fuscipes fuscipes]
MARILAIAVTLNLFLLISSHEEYPNLEFPEHQFTKHLAIDSKMQILKPVLMTLNLQPIKHPEHFDIPSTQLRDNESLLETMRDFPMLPKNFPIPKVYLTRVSIKAQEI